ncbi:hypothetical protein AGOR_G00050870 [Albula goreensis]|uniref:Fucosyltransferase n=1 Tax=Albula goreensis TaxID=1534307 RepID=A0A8T3DSW9_9TELE|nr:hypothetical protein AGOR_G00050870 [Albula goreensis]
MPCYPAGPGGCETGFNASCCPSATTHSASPASLITKFFSILLLGLFTLLSYWLLVPKTGVKSPVQRNRNISILLWYWPFSRPLDLEGDVCWDLYAIPGCYIMDNHSKFSEADVVVFHHHELKTHRWKLPHHLHRPPKQKWLWLSLESPATNGNLTPYDSVFNWTMTYRHDSDIFMPYGKLVPKSVYRDGGGHAIPRKNLLACWVVSNYRSRQKRAQIYQSLKKLVPIAVYGKWHKKPLSAEELLPTIKRCHFYLAFENSNFTDYITEKLWRNSFLADTVPVVFGPPRQNYEKVVPSNSFIHVDDFNSTKSLAEFLHQLVANKEGYASYFEWHRNYSVKILSDWRERLCHICKHYDQLPAHKAYHHLDAWSRR